MFTRRAGGVRSIIFLCVCSACVVGQDTDARDTDLCIREVVEDLGYFQSSFRDVVCGSCSKAPLPWERGLYEMPDGSQYALIDAIGLGSVTAYYDASGNLAAFVSCGDVPLEQPEQCLDTPDVFCTWYGRDMSGGRRVCIESDECSASEGFWKYSDTCGLDAFLPSGMPGDCSVRLPAP